LQLVVSHQFSSSAFGIKSTAPANASIFGQPKPQGSLFGNTQQQPSTSTFGSAPQTQPATQAPNSFLGGFGQNQQQQQPAPAGGSLFGQQSQQPQQPQQNAFGGNSLFGNPTNNNQANQPAQQQNTFTNFGSTTNTQQQQGQQPQQTTGLWGQNTSSNPLQAQSTVPAGGFGLSTNNPLFGGQQKQQQQQQQQQQSCVTFRTSLFFFFDYCSIQTRVSVISVRSRTGVIYVSCLVVDFSLQAPPYSPNLRNSMTCQMN
jgi:nucleoporin p58/p45